MFFEKSFKEFPVSACSVGFCLLTSKEDRQSMCPLFTVFQFNKQLIRSYSVLHKVTRAETAIIERKLG